MVDGLKHHTVTLDGLRTHFVEAGQGDAVVLLHGWAQTWWEWRRIMPGLARSFRVVAPDLRGMGDTGRPRTGYDKKTVASDVHRLLDHLGIARAHVVGHDFGVAVAFALAHQWPQRVRSLALMEMMLPGFGGEQAFNIGRNSGRWHMVFHARCELAEMLVAGCERDYLSWFYRTFAYDPTAISEEDVDEYTRAYSQPGAMGASFEHYRTLFDDEEQFKSWGQERLTMPVLAVGGASNMGDRVFKMMQGLGTDVSGGVVERAGHWIPDERPDWLLDNLPAFFAGCAAREQQA